VLARNQKWASKKIFGISLVTAVGGHVALSIVMSLVVVAIGLYFSHWISSHVNIGIGNNHVNCRFYCRS